MQSSLAYLRAGVEIGEISPLKIKTKLSASSDLVRRLELQRKLEGHNGCVNTVQFTPDGRFLISSGDDLLVMVWEHDTGRLLFKYESGHNANVFQAKALPYSNNSKVVSCAADGQVRIAHIPEGASGDASVVSKKLASHNGRAHKLSIVPGSANCFLSCGEDGEIRHFDVRESTATHRMLVSRDPNAPFNNARHLIKLELNSIFCNPLEPYTIVVGGGDQYVRVFDLRKSASVKSFSPTGVAVAQPTRICTPKHLERATGSVITDGLHITSCIFNAKGEILASYNDEQAYLFCAERHVARSNANPNEETEEDKGRKPKQDRAPPSRDDSSSSSPSEMNTGTSSDTSESNSESPSPTSEDLDDSEEEEDEDGEDYLGARYLSLLPPMSDSSETATDEDEEQHHDEDDRDWGNPFDDSDDEPSIEAGEDGVLMRYQGHRNAQTVKSINFFGANEEYVVSGSDCGHIFVWQTSTGRLKTMLKGDRYVVNCLEPHPHHLLKLATSGIEDDVKIWAPTASEPASLGMEARRVVALNEQRRRMSNRPLVVSRDIIRFLMGPRPEAVGDDMDDSSSDDGEGHRHRQPDDCTVM